MCVCACSCTQYCIITHFTFHFVITGSSLILAQIDLMHVGYNWQMIMSFSRKTVHFIVFNIYESLRFILVLDSHLLLDLHNCLLLSGFPTTDTTALIFIIRDFHILSPSYSYWFFQDTAWCWLQILKLLILKDCPNYVTASWVEQHCLAPYPVMSTVCTPSSLTETKILSNIKRQTKLKHFRF